MRISSVLSPGAFAVLCSLLVACGGDKPPGNAEVDAAMWPVTCGDMRVEGDEQCDDGNMTADAECDERCHFTCGNGRVDAELGEKCDSGISSGAGACPTSCDDGMACTADVLSGSGCQAACENAPITAPADGDGCCPPGANSLNDDDCEVACGNMLVEEGETCDIGILAGTGACPTACNDGMVCTTDMLAMGGTCRAVCNATPIVTPMNGDGCCPPGANTSNDNDCSPGCGNGALDPGETCDTAIATGPGSCPSSCEDNMACTRNVLTGSACTVACSFPAITTCTNGDGCCPATCNANNDNNCTPSCGNGVVETGEQCDDGNAIPTDDCHMCMFVNPTPTAFRMRDLDLRDPHVFVSFITCNDVTDTELAGFAVNKELQESVTTDGDDMDTFLDLSPTLVFRPFNQAAGATMPTVLHLANCTSPMSSTMCSPGTQQAAITATNGTGTAACLTPLAGTTTPRMPAYTPAITNTSAACFSTTAATVTITLGGIPITLRDARIAATYVGNPANTTSNGLLMGFISETEANNTIIPMTFPLVGGKPLSLLLPGGDPPGPERNCAAHDDRDMHNGVRGWWFYLNFPAGRVPWMD